MQQTQMDYGKEMEDILRRLMKGIENNYHLSPEIYGKPFDDTKIYLDKVMVYQTNFDESKGWTGTLSAIADKPKDSKVILLVTYDGAGYDYFSDSGDCNGILKHKFCEELKKKFGDKFIVEDCNNWAFEVSEFD